jgi:hypothetical protein
MWRERGEQESVHQCRNSVRSQAPFVDLDMLLCPLCLWERELCALHVSVNMRELGFSK